MIAKTIKLNKIESDTSSEIEGDQNNNNGGRKLHERNCKCNGCKGKPRKKKMCTCWKWM